MSFLLILAAASSLAAAPAADVAQPAPQVRELKIETPGAYVARLSQAERRPLPAKAYKGAKAATLSAQGAGAREAQIDTVTAARDAASRCGPANTFQRSGTDGRRVGDYTCSMRD